MLEKSSQIEALIPSVMSTHPGSKERIEEIKQYTKGSNIPYVEPIAIKTFSKIEQ